MGNRRLGVLPGFLMALLWAWCRVWFLPGCQVGKWRLNGLPGYLMALLWAYCRLHEGQKFFAEGREAYGVLSCMLKN